MERKNLYITQSWILSRKDNTLLFHNQAVKKVIPIIWIEQIYALGEITVNSKLLSFLTEHKITLHFFNYYGFYTGSYVPRESYVSGKLLVSQVDHYQDQAKRLKIAKAIVAGIAANQIHLLRHYQRHWKNILGYIHKIQQVTQNLPKIRTILELLNAEGTLWEIFYASFKKFLPEDFHFQTRTKRPPKDPMNALISFGNSLLYTYTLSKIYHTQLNPTISYLHEPFERRFSLALDLAENFKLAIVFPVIFNLVNRGSLKVQKHFEKNLNYAYLNAEWRKIFLKAWDAKLQQTIDHPTLKRKVSYGSLIKFDAYKLIKHLLGEKEFTPFDLDKKL